MGVYWPGLVSLRTLKIGYGIEYLLSAVAKLLKPFLLIFDSDRLVLVDGGVHKRLFVGNTGNHGVLVVVVLLVSKQILLVHGLLKLSHVSISFQLVVEVYLRLQNISVGLFFQPLLFSLLVIPQSDISTHPLYLIHLTKVESLLSVLRLLFLLHLLQEGLPVSTHGLVMQVPSKFILLLIPILLNLVLHPFFVNLCPAFLGIRV